MTVPPVLLSVNVGLPKNVAWRGKTVYTGADGEVLICCARPSADAVLDM